MAEEEDVKSFKELGVCDQLVEACDSLGWKSPSKIQAEALPHAFEGKDLIGLAQTGSGKTGAFAIPILQALLETPQAFFACALSPTRKLAIQIAEQFEALGSGIGVKCVVLVGGVDHVQQSIALGKRPHIVPSTVIGTLICLVQYELEWYIQIEKLIGKKLPEFPAQEEEVLLLLERVMEAKRISIMKIKETGGKKRRKDGDDEEEVHKYLDRKNGKSFKKSRKR